MLNFSILKTQMQSGFATHNNSANEAAGKSASAFDAYIKTIANLPERAQGAQASRSY